MWYACKDAFGSKDVVEEAKRTLRGEGMDYREFEPLESHIHQGIARDRRIKAGLRYSKGGKHKYWLPRYENSGGPIASRNEEESGPLLEPDEEAVHTTPYLHRRSAETSWDPPEERGYELPFGDVYDTAMEGDEELLAVVFPRSPAGIRRTALAATRRPRSGCRV